MESLLSTINITVAIFLVIEILLQKSEGGALGLGSSQDTFVSSRTASNFLTKTTSILAAIFIITSIMLTIISNKSIPQTSIIDTVDEKNEQSLPEIPKTNN